MDTFPNFNEYLEGACNQSEQIRKQSELSIGQAKEADTVSKIISIYLTLLSRATKVTLSRIFPASRANHSRIAGILHMSPLTLS